MKKNHLFFLTVFLLFSCSEEQVVPTSNRPELGDHEIALVESIAEYSTPIASSPLTIEDSDLTVIDKVADASIVALGEASHGTKEFFEMKHRITY